MPLYNVKGHSLLFLHIPKCGGTTIESLLSEDFGEPAFFGKAECLGDFNLQHSDADMLQSMLPCDFVDYSFLVVRHPVDKLLSAYQWTYKDDAAYPELIPPFPLWVDYVLFRCQRDVCHGNNFFKPQVKFLYPGCEVFKLEEGLSRAVYAIENRFGIKLTGNLSHKFKTKKIPGIFVDEYTLSKIRDRYRDDFETFGYSLDCEVLLAQKKITLVPGKCGRLRLWFKFMLGGGARKLVRFIRLRLMAA